LVIKINPTVAVVFVVILVLIAGFAAWQSFSGGPSEFQASTASHSAVQKTTVEIPQAIGAEPGKTAPPQVQGGTVNTPLMGGGSR